MNKLKIGNITLDTPVILAPMAGVNCAAFRLLCREYGAGMVSTPMLVSNQVIGNAEKLIERTCYLKQEKPIMTQLLGSDRKIMEEAARIVEEFSDIIDVNLGCPEKDALAIKAGAFLVKHPEQIEKAVGPVIGATNKPVTAKIRTGWDKDSIRTLDIVKILEDLGVSAITIHARTKEQKYTGKADWEEIRKAKEKANVPIIGNGDIFKPGTAKAMIERTKCDGVMVARGAIGNPLLFKGIKEIIEEGKSMPEPTEKEKIDSFMRFLNYYRKFEKTRSFTELRQHSMWFTKGIPGAKVLRNKLMRSESVEEILDIYSGNER
ncbi:MAG: tRNA dihydrouridine synthase DusB [Nanoarchaeota archaeon]|nr:tRNA dihydrouridine synthase DusB [Nanoarchaeota archaeon]